MRPSKKQWIFGVPVAVLALLFMAVGGAWWYLGLGESDLPDGSEVGISGGKPRPALVAAADEFARTLGGGDVDSLVSLAAPTGKTALAGQLTKEFRGLPVRVDSYEDEFDTAPGVNYVVDCADGSEARFMIGFSGRNGRWAPVLWGSLKDHGSGCPKK